MKNLYTHIMGRLSFCILGAAVLAMSLACDSGNQTANKTSATPNASPTATVAATSPERDREAISAVIKGVVDDTQRATQNRDNIAAEARNLDKYFDDDVTIIDSSGVTRGWATYRDKNLGPQLRTIAANNHRVGSLNIAVEGNMAVVSYPYTVDADVNGKPTTIFGYGTTVLRRRGNDWRILHTQSSGRPIRDTDPKF